MNPIAYWLMTRYNKTHWFLSSIAWYLDYHRDIQLGDGWEDAEDYYSGRRRRARSSWLERTPFLTFCWSRLVEGWKAPAREFDWRDVPSA